MSTADTDTAEAVASIRDLEASQRGLTSDAECRAMRLLRRDGWQPGVLAMTFQIDRDSVAHHVGGHCSHDDRVPSLRGEQ